MKNSFLYSILLISLCLYAGLCYFLHPRLACLLDSDAVAYLTIAKRVASGQYNESINGLWSPLNSWLLVPFIQHGSDAWLSAKALNCFFGAVIIVLMYFLLIRFRVGKLAFISLMIATSVIMVHCIYLQMFGDVLQLIFVLSYLLIVWSKKFNDSYFNALLCGLCMGIGFYAKAYSIIFFILHFSVTIYWYYKHQHIEYKRMLIQLSIGLCSAILLVLPWTFALHKKYGTWSLTGNAGKLNMSWYINSGKTFKDDITLLIPPTYHDSPSFWEDPYPSQDKLSTPFTSPKHFVKWIARIIHTCLMAVVCYNEISFLALTVLLISCYYFFFRKKETKADRNDISMQQLLLTVLILPFGYLMMHIETRYIWLNGFLLMIASVVLIEQFKSKLHDIIYKTSIIIAAFSFIVFPIMDIKNLSYKNNDLFNYANEINRYKLNGSFTSNSIDAGRMWVVAYLTHMPFYTIERTNYDENELIAEMKRYNVKYYLYESQNNKSPVSIAPESFRFMFKANGFDLYELK